MADRDDEVSALQDVARAILSVHDPAQVLLTVNDRLLAAVRGRHRRGLAVRGRGPRDEQRLRAPRDRARPARIAQVRAWPADIETGEPLMVDDYLEAEEISDHFVQLAEKESVRSALGVPMRDRSGMLGVLEVWRRRASTFSAGRRPPHGGFRQPSRRRHLQRPDVRDQQRR